MKLKTLMSAVIFGLALGPAMANAQTNHDAMPHMGAQKQATSVQGEGVVTAVNAGKHKITLKHEPIPELNWPQMIMGFSVAPEVDLSGLSKGDSVTFTLMPAGKNQVIIAIRKH